MERLRCPSPRAFDAILLAGTLLGCALIVHAAALFGPGILQFALHQFYAAEALRAGEPLTMTRGEPYTIWPPLMPVLLAAGRSLGIDYSSGGLVLGVVGAAGIYFFAAKLVARVSGSLGLGIALLAFLVVSPEVLEAAMIVRNEPLFVAPVLATLVALAWYLDHPGRAPLAWASLAAAVACSQHYKGVVLVTAGGLILLSYPTSLAWRTRLRNAVVFGTVAMLPLVLWMIRNLQVEGTLHGERGEQCLAFTLQAKSAWITYAFWIERGTESDEPRGIVNVAVAAALVLLVLARVVRPASSAERGRLLLFLSFPLLYTVFLLSYAYATTLDQIDQRLLFPAYPFVWGTLFLGFGEAQRHLAARPAWLRRGVLGALLVVFALAVVPAAERTLRVIEESRTDGPGGFATARRHRSPVVRWLRTQPVADEIYSNLPELVLYATGRRARRVDADSVAHALANGPGGYLVWFEHRWATPAPRLELLSDGIRLESVVCDEGGVVERIVKLR